MLAQSHLPISSPGQPPPSRSLTTEQTDSKPLLPLKAYKCLKNCDYPVVYSHVRGDQSHCLLKAHTRTHWLKCTRSSRVKQEKWSSSRNYRGKCAEPEGRWLTRLKKSCERAVLERLLNTYSTQCHLTHHFSSIHSLNSFSIVLDYLPFSFRVPSARLRLHVCPVSEIFVTLVISTLHNAALSP